MYKILIVDDEYLVREGLRLTIDWEALGLQVCGLAADGAEGLAMAERFKPDIVMTDMKMPVMDGVTMIKQLGERGILPRTIVLSGYRDFDYAKQSFEAGVTNYVLKPISNDELIAVLRKTVEELKKGEAQSQLVQKIEKQRPLFKAQCMHDLLHGVYQSEEEFRLAAGSAALTVSFPLGLFDFKLVETEEGQSRPQLLAALESELKELFAPLSIEGTRQEGHLIYLVPEADLEAVSEQIRQFISGLQSDAERTVIAARSRLVAGFGDVYPAYLELMKFANSQVLVGTSFYFGTVDNSVKHAKNLYLLLQFIAVNYRYDISVRQAAEKLKVSESYLMHLVKSSLNRTFNDLLVNHRLMIAKRLLCRGDLRINEVADQVGFNDVKYFSQVFKKKIGMTPSEYLGQHR